MANDKGFFNYWVVANSGKGFITHVDSRKFWISGYPGNVWVCDDIPESRDWGARNSAATKTKSQAQTIVDAAISGSYYMEGPDSGSQVIVTISSSLNQDMWIVTSLTPNKRVCLAPDLD